MKLLPPRGVPITLSSSSRTLRTFGAPSRSAQGYAYQVQAISRPYRRGHASTSRPKHPPSARLSSTMNPTASEASPLLSCTESEPPSPLPPSSPGSTASIRLASTGTLLRSYLVYTLCSLPLLIDNSPRLLHAFTHSPVPGLKALTEWGVRHTFFAQFVPGETVEECVHTMRQLRDRGVGSVLNYSAEVEEDVAAASSLSVADTLRESTGGAGGTDGHLGPLSRRSSADSAEGPRGIAKMLEKQRLDEVIKALRVSGDYELDIESKGGARGSTGFALKITGLIDPMILQRASTTLLRLRHAEKEDKGGVPYPGTPVSGDGRVVASSPGSVDQSIFNLKGTVPNMGVLDSDEGVRPADLEEMYALWKNLCGMCEEAKTHGIKLMVDAEHTWYQPALDAYTLLLSEKYNRPPKDGKWTGPLIYGTYQSYLVRQKTHLPAALQHAKENGYALGIKLVRGAYFVQERKKWKDEGRSGADPIWTDKHATDVSYNSAINTILSSLSSQLSSDPSHALSVVFGTHNPESVDLIIGGLKTNGLAKEVDGRRLRLREDVKGRIGVAQLYGMKDDLMDKVVETFEPSNQPVSLKYIAYGKLDEVIPFLGRRAIENKSLMSGEGGAAAERRRIWAELSRRYFGQGETATA